MQLDLLLNPVCNMLISDWARFDDMMDATPATNAQPLHWESGPTATVAPSAGKTFSDVDTSSSSANDSWANFSGYNEDDANWADFTGLVAQDNSRTGDLVY